MRFSPLLAAGALATGVAATTNYLGFNSGSQMPDGSAKTKDQFIAEFKAAQNLVGAPGTFNAVRLYTNIQAYSKTDPISAFEAAIETKTSILLGVWASGVTDINNELTALQTAVTNYGSKLTDLIIGISIGSEDLYRISVTGTINKAGVGNSPDAIAGFISDYKKKFANTAMANVPVGHVDTWDSWANSSNKAVIDAVDWVGLDTYPFYETGKGNSINESGQLFDHDFAAAKAAIGGKPMWMTETGWPTDGSNWDLAVPSVSNAKYYWNEVGCRRLFNQVPTFWFTLRDDDQNSNYSFAITNNLSTTPLFDLSCPTTFVTPSSSTSSGSGSSSTKTASVASGSATGTATTTGTASGSAATAASSGASGTAATGVAASSTTGSSASATTTPAKNAASGSQTFSAATGLLAVVAGLLAIL